MNLDVRPDAEGVLVGRTRSCNQHRQECAAAGERRSPAVSLAYYRGGACCHDRGLEQVNTPDRGIGSGNVVGNPNILRSNADNRKVGVEEKTPYWLPSLCAHSRVLNGKSHLACGRKAASARRTGRKSEIVEQFVGQCTAA